MKWEIMEGDTDGCLLETVEFSTLDEAYEYAYDKYLDLNSKLILELGGELPYNPNNEIIVREARRQ